MMKRKSEGSEGGVAKKLRQDSQTNESEQTSVVPTPLDEQSNKDAPVPKEKSNPKHNQRVSDMKQIDMKPLMVFIWFLFFSLSIYIYYLYSSAWNIRYIAIPTYNLLIFLYQARGWYQANRVEANVGAPEFNAKSLRTVVLANIACFCWFLILWVAYWILRRQFLCNGAKICTFLRMAFDGHIADFFVSVNVVVCALHT